MKMNTKKYVVFISISSLNRVKHLAFIDRYTSGRISNPKSELFLCKFTTFYALMFSIDTQKKNFFRLTDDDGRTLLGRPFSANHIVIPGIKGLTRNY